MACQCPVCQISLTPRVFDAARFEECGKCGGVWMLRETLVRIESKDANELEVIDNMIIPTRVEIAASSVKACPSCGRGMERFHFLVDSPVELDCCNPCGG